MDLQQVVKRLGRFAPLHLAGSWDNVGLLVEPPNKSNVRSMILTNDLTEDVLDETLSVGADFILSYHPPIFKPLKKITTMHWKERIVGRCLKSGIAVYSPHTAYDAIDGGVNDWLVRAFGDADTKAIEKATERPEKGFTITVCGEGTQGVLKQFDNMKKPGEAFIDFNRSFILCNQDKLASCIAFLSTVGGKDFHYVISKNEETPITQRGMGRLAILTSHQTIGSVVERVKSMTGLSHVRLALARGHNMDTIVRTGAVCAGSGISVLRNCNADVLLTGEMGHHDVLELAQTRRTVILLEHSNSERGFLSDVLKHKLQELFENKVSVTVSTADKDPLKFV